MFKNNVDKNSRAYLENKVASARHSLLLVIVFTVINIVLLLIEANSYFLFSAAVPYYVTLFGAVMDLQTTGSMMGTFTITALVISAVILALYLVCWLLTKKRTGWYIAAAVLFILDTVALVLLGLDVLAENVVDILFHGWVLVELFQAVAAAKKLKNMPPEVLDVEGQPVPQPAVAEPQEPWERKDLE